MSEFRRRLMMTKSGGGGVLPAGYIPLDFIRNDATAVIDTGIINKSSVTIEAGIRWVGQSSGRQWFGNDTAGMAFGRYQDKWSNTSTPANGTSISYNEYTILSDVVASGSIAGRNHYLFGASQSARQSAKCDLSYYRIKNNGVLLYEYAPCISPNNIVGLYDMKNKEFKSSITSSPLIAPPENGLYSVLTKTSVYNGVIPLGITFGENTRVQIKMQMSNQNGNFLADLHSSNNSNTLRMFLTGNNIYFDFLGSRINSSYTYSQLRELEFGNYYIKDLETGTIIKSSTAKTGFTRPCQLYLFGNQTDNSTIGFTGQYGDVYYVKIYQGESLVLDAVPYCENHIIGLYDYVSNSMKLPIATFTGTL